MLKVSQTEIYEYPRGYGANKSPPERLRYQKTLQKHLKIVKFVEVVSKREEACAYTFQSQKQGVSEYWKVALISRNLVVPRKKPTVDLLIRTFQTQQPQLLKLRKRMRCGQYLTSIQKLYHSV